jgi:hypothetical protein
VSEPIRGIGSPSVMEVLAELATEDCSSSEHRNEILREIQSPNWQFLDSDESTWSLLIPAELEELWSSLTPEAQVAIYIVAKAGSDRIGGVIGAMDD